MIKIYKFVANAMKPCLFILTIILLTYLAIGKSLQFALNGDDWLALWRFHTTFPTFNALFNLNNYYTNYDVANIMMGIIYYFFSYNPFYYYLTSLILRIFAIISLYFAVYVSTKSKMAGLLSSLFLSSMFAGIETTNWVFNMNTYLALTLVNISIFLFFKDIGREIIRLFLLAMLSTTAFIIAPTRMHGLVLFIPMLIFITQGKENFFKNFLWKCILLLIPLLVIQDLFSAGDIKTYLNSFLPSLKDPFITAGVLLADVGHILLPNKIIVFNHINPSPGYILLGLCYFAFALFTAYKFRKILPQPAKISLLFLLLPIFFLIIPLMINYPTSFSSEHRYLLIPGAYLLSSVAINLALLWQIKWARGIITLIIFLIVLINLSTLNWYFDLLSKEGRLQIDRQKQFSTIQSLIKGVPKDTPLVFLILPDDPFYAYNAIQFGFSFQIILTDNRFSWDRDKEPLLVDNFDNLPVDIPIENIYILTLQNKSLLDTTSSYKPFILEKLFVKNSQEKNN